MAMSALQIWVRLNFGQKYKNTPKKATEIPINVMFYKRITHGCSKTAINNPNTGIETL